MRLVIAVLVAAVASTLLPAPPAAAQPKRKDKDAFNLGDLVDYALLAKELKPMAALRLESRKINISLHEVMMTLAEQPDEATEKKLRAIVHEHLLDLRRIKVAHIDKVNPILRHKPPKTPDLDVLKKLRATSLGSVDWKEKRFWACIALLEGVTGLKIYMHAMVNPFNGVFLRQPNITADTVLKFICTGFDLKWFVYQGEVYIVRKVDPNEDRYKRYEKKHGKVDYWRDEPEELTRKVDGKRVSQTVFDMDIAIVRQNLLKFFIFEEESRIHQQKLKELKFIKQTVERSQLATQNPKLLKLAKRRERNTVHYLRVEKESAIETLDIIGRILGDKVRLEADAKQEWLDILAKPVKGIFWEDLPLDEALSDLGRRIGVPIVAEIPLIEVPYISLTIERGTLETTINMIVDIHPMEVKYRKGKIFFFWR